MARNLSMSITLSASYCRTSHTFLLILSLLSYASHIPTHMVLPRLIYSEFPASSNPKGSIAGKSLNLTRFGHTSICFVELSNIAIVFSHT